MTPASVLWGWTLVLVQLALCTVLMLVGLLILGFAAHEAYVYVTGRRTPDGRRRLNLVAEMRAAARAALDEQDDYASRAVRIDGRRVHGRVLRHPLSPLSTPMTREIAAWHGLRHLRRALDTRIGTYPLYFHDPAKSDPS